MALAFSSHSPLPARAFASPTLDRQQLRRRFAVRSLVRAPEFTRAKMSIASLPVTISCRDHPPGGHSRSVHLHHGIQPAALKGRRAGAPHFVRGLRRYFPALSRSERGEIPARPGHHRHVHATGTKSTLFRGRSAEVLDGAHQGQPRSAPHVSAAPFGEYQATVVSRAVRAPGCREELQCAAFAGGWQRRLPRR